MDKTHRALRGTGHARGTLHRDQRHGDETRHKDAARRVASSRGTSRRTRQTLARHCSHARTSTIAPSRARTSRHFSRTFDGITLAAMFDTIDGRTAHARAAADFFSLPPPRAPNRLPFYRVFTMISRQFLFSYVVYEDCAVFFFLFFNESIFPPLADK